jgi:hypothetical protein
MDFFGAQENARKRTGKLVFLFCVAVLLIAAAIFVVLAIVLPLALAGDDGVVGIQFFNFPGFLATLVGVGGFVGACSLWKTSQLAAGGAVVARSLGGVKVEAHTRDAQERMLMNVVEEMAIASGVPVPEVYVLE